jgi:hypothetical protein
MDEKQQNERPLFQGIDDLEKEYAPEELSPDDPENARVRAEEGAGGSHTPSDIEEPENPNTA